MIASALTRGAGVAGLKRDRRRRTVVIMQGMEFLGGEKHIERMITRGRFGPWRGYPVSVDDGVRNVTIRPALVG
jgi:hypothetical protein